MASVVQREELKGKIDFDGEVSSTDDEKGWTDSEKQVIFNYLIDKGVSYTPEGRSNWVDIRDEIKQIPGYQNFDKSISQVEKFVIAYKSSSPLPSKTQISRKNKIKFTFMNSTDIKTQITVPRNALPE